MSEPSNNRRPNYLRQQPTVASTTTGLVLFFTYASILTPVIAVLNGIKTIFGGVANPIPSGSNEPEINLQQTLISDWELKRIVKPMIGISHMDIEWFRGPTPKTFLFNSNQLSLLHARAESIAVTSSGSGKEIQIAREFMDYITRDGHRKTDNNITQIRPDENKLG
jgi:hypothetical protein